MAVKLPAEFKLERYFEKYEFTTRYLLSCSDAEAFSVKELLALADPESKVSQVTLYVITCFPQETL